MDCSYLRMHGGTLKLKQSHSYYWQVQGQLLLRGMEWCDFVVFAEEDILIQRIYRDWEVAKTIHFFFFLLLHVNVIIILTSYTYTFQSVMKVICLMKTLFGRKCCSSFHQ